MNQPSSSRPNQVLIALAVALAVFTIGLIGITLGLRTLGQRTGTATPTRDLASLPITPLVRTPTPVGEATGTPTTTPTPTASPTASPTPTPTQPAPTATPTPGPTPYAGPLRSNGGDYVALRRENITLDGALGDWNGVPAVALAFVQVGAENRSGSADFAVNMRLAWNDRYLFMAAEVTDDTHVQVLRSYDLYNGDDIEMWIDADLPGDFSDNNANGDDYQFGFSAGNFAGAGPEGVVWTPERRDDWNAQLATVAVRRNDGYILEAAIPWVIMDVRPVEGMYLGFALNASDNDAPDTTAQQTILMHTPGMVWGQPGTFSNLRLQ